MELHELVLILIALLSSGVSAYMETKQKLSGKVTELIGSAEKAYEGQRRAGAKKQEYVVERLYALVPLPLRPIFTRNLLGALASGVFANIEQYANLQVNKEKGGDTDAKTHPAG